MNLSAPALRDRRLRALGVEPLRLRACAAAAAVALPDVPNPLPVAAPVPPEPAPDAAVAVASAPPAIRRLALQPDHAALDDPVIAKMYASLTDAVGKAGLQGVRARDVADDPTAAVMVFGGAAAPAGVPEARVLRVDPLAVLHADRSRKRALWERMQALGRGDA